MSYKRNEMNSNTDNNRGNRQGGRGPPPALNPETPGLVQPFKDFVSRGLCEIFVSFTPMGVSISVNPLGQIREDGEDNNTRLPLGTVKKRIEDAGLSNAKKAKDKSASSDKQPLPTKTLSDRDFEGTSDAQLINRIRAVANALGSDVAKSRILTHKLNESGVADFEQWWTDASAAHRAMMLMDKKHAEKVGTAISRLKTMNYQCPFRGTLQSPSKEKADAQVKVNGVKPKQDDSKGKERASSSGSSASKNGRK